MKESPEQMATRHAETVELIERHRIVILSMHSIELFPVDNNGALMHTEMARHWTALDREREELWEKIAKKAL
jgi:hypothetical protein